MLHKESLSCKNYAAHGKYNYATLTRRFGGWNEVLKRAGLSVENGRYKHHDYCESDEILFEDMRRVAKMLGRNYVSRSEYNQYGRFSYSRQNKYGGWNGILVAAGLEKSAFRKYSNEELFEEMERMWIKLGRQPSMADFGSQGTSMINSRTYLNRFGGWRKALEAFVNYINSADENDEDVSTQQTDVRVQPVLNDEKSIVRHKTRRDINLRLRFRVMARDHFKCCKCGKSPATDPTVILHIDHIYPWAKGGETVMENLQTLCSECNLGKSDLLIDNG